MPIVRLEQAEKVYGSVVKTRALLPTDLELDEGELVVVLGPSGSGKTTLLNLIGGLDAPTAGHVRVAGRELAGLSAEALGEFRRASIGFVFQFFNLIPSLTALENVVFAAELVGPTDDVPRLLDAVGLSGLGDRFPAELSGGQQQRVAIARALAKRPALLLADEPTGALDHDTGRQVLALLRGAASEGGRAVVIVTHDESIVELADRVIRLRDGRVIANEQHRPAA